MAILEVLLVPVVPVLLVVLVALSLLWTLPELLDTDGDGLTDFEEINYYGTDPNNADTDGDGVTDGDEVAQGTDPTVYNEPGDLGEGLSDLDKDQYYDEPLKPVSDGDVLTNGGEAFIYVYLYACMHVYLWDVLRVLIRRQPFVG